MNHPHDDHIHPEFPAEVDSQEALDRALDALARGDDRALDDLDAGMQTTVDHLFALAALGGFTTDTSEEMPSVERDGSPSVRSLRPGHATTPPVQIRPPAATTSRRRRVLMSTLSGIAAALLLGLSIYAAVPIFTNDQEPPRTEIAFQAMGSTPDATADTQEGTTASATPSRDVPADVIYTGGEPITNADGVPYTPPQGTELTGVVGSDVRNPVSPSECVIEPRSREEVVTVLSTPPADGATYHSSDGSNLDEETVSEIQATFREWQSCVRFGKTFQAAALETDQFIRTDFYDDGGVLGTWQLVDTPYSEETINGILDGRIDLDNAKAEWGDKQAQGAPGSESGLNLNLWVIDTSQPTADPTLGTYPAADGGTYFQATVVWTNPSLLDGGSSGPSGALPSAYVTFQLVDGQWRIDHWIDRGIQPPVAD